MDKIGFIKHKINEFTSDSITFGMTYVNDENEVKIWFSKNKIKMIKKIINKENFKLLNNHIKNIKEVTEYTIENLDISIKNKLSFCYYTELTEINTSSCETKQCKRSMIKELFKKHFGK